MSQFTVVDLPSHADPRGSLSVLDRILPFPVVRAYWIYGADGQVRGGHRHGVTRQALVAIHGVVSVYVNDGTHEATVSLDHPSKCLLVEPEDWHTMTFGSDSVLLCFASHSYDRSDYIDTPYE